MLAVWLADGAAAEDAAGAVVPVDAELEPAAVAPFELPLEGVVAALEDGAVACIPPAFWPLEPALVEGWSPEPWLVEPWLAEP
jgi:hypothetical protein